VADDTWLDDDGLDTDEAELADRMHISGERWRKLAVFAVVVGLLVYAAITYVQRRDDREEQAAAEEEHHQEADPAVTTTFATGEDLTPIEPTCPEEPYTERAVQFTEAPPTCIDEDATYVATVETTRGDFEITLDSETAPIAVNNFVFLARWRYYDGVGFHAAIPRFELTTGDPIGPTAGFGGPGYTIEDEPPPATDDPPYPVLSVGMSRSADEPDSNGGRFFIVIGDAGTGTPGDSYTRFGHVTDGEDVIRDIEATGNREGTPPQDLTVIEQITIEERN
jgi:cyclophilin family peptidyl-prolyl cis-trans isomerase